MGYESKVYSKGTPALWLPADEVSGNLTNRGSEGGTFTARGTPVYRVVSPLLSRAINLDAPDSDKFTKLTGVLAGDVSFSIAAWVRTVSTDAVSGYAGNPALTVLGDWSSNILRGYGIHGGFNQLRKYDTAWKTLTGTRPVNDGSWHLIGVSYNATTDLASLFTDGVADGTATIADYTSPVGCFSAFGSGYGNATEAGSGDAFNGDLGALAGWNLVLVAADFLDLYNSGLRDGIVPQPGMYGGSAYGQAPYGGWEASIGKTYEALVGASSPLVLGGTGNLSMLVKMTGTSTLVLGGSGSLRGLEYLATWTVDDSGKAQLVLSGIGSLDVRVPPTTVATNQVQQVSLGPVTSGTFTITFLGQTTAAIAYNASAATIQAALVALSNVNPGDVIVSGGPAPGTFWIEYTGQYAATTVTPATINITLLVGAVLSGGTLVPGGRSSLSLLKRVSHTKSSPVLDWRGKPI